MAILHGGWIASEQYFFLWGETWRRLAPTSTQAPPFTPRVTPELVAHPYSQTAAELAPTLLEAGGSPPWQLPPTLLATAGRGGRKAAKGALAADRLRSQLLALPSLIQQDHWRPLHSGELLPDEAPPSLYPWQVTGVTLTPTEAWTFLSSLPLGSGGETSLGSDLRYWGHVTRWGLDLLARTKFVPALGGGSEAEGPQQAVWQLLLDSAVDQARLGQFAQRMPLACRTYQRQAGHHPHPPQIDLLPAPPPLLLNFLQAVVDAQVRAQAHTLPLPSLTLGDDLPIKPWLLALGHEADAIAEEPARRRLQEALATWTRPLQNLQADHIAPFRAGFQLHPPTADSPDGQTWQLTYGLQAIDDPNFYVDAASIWQHSVDQMAHQGRLIPDPQETLLAGLGRAARLYEPIKASLSQGHPSHCPLDPIQAFEFIKRSAWQLQDNGFGVILPPGLANPDDDRNSRLGLKLKAEPPSRKQRQRLGLKSLLNFEWEISLAGQILSQKEFEKLLALQSPLVEINGQWVELRPQEVKAAQNFFTQRQTERTLSVEDALRISTGDAQTLDKLPVVSFEAEGALKELINTLTTGNQTLDEIEEPDGFKGTLRPYQARGVSWLAFLEQWGLGACLADDMGLGKTIQLIGFLLHLRSQDLLDQPSLLVCPTSVLSNWQREVKKFAPALNTLVYHGDRRPHGSNFVKAVQGVDLVITSYALVYRDLRDLKRIEWQGVVLDEAQNIKNPAAKQSQAVRDLPAQFRIALTGTPVENRLSELWAIMDFLNPGYLGPRNFFQRRFATPIERYGDTASLKTLRSLVQPFILRRLKTDRTIIQDLPEKQEMTVFCGLSAEQATLYQKLVDESIAAIDSADGVQRRGLILALLTKLKQVCNHPAQFLQESPAPAAPRSGKLQRLNEMLEEVVAEGDRALIFTQFAEWGKLLQAHLQQSFGEETLLLYGGTSKKQREDMVDRFQQDPNAPKLFILSLKAGGVGLNLTRANHVFHFDRWWNPAVENQATDRVFRIGQTRNVQVHKFVCTGTLEERIHELIEGKKELSEQVVGAGEQWLTELDSDQLRNLLFLDRSAIMDA